MSVEVVRVSGSGRERGRAVGSALRESIHRSLGFYRRMLERRGRSPADLPHLLGEHWAAAAACPEHMEELTGMAEGAGASWWELFAVNAFEELEPMLERTGSRLERCTAFATSGPDGTVLAHNEQWYAGDAGNVAVVVAAPEDGLPFASPSVVACLPAVGMNGAGVAQSIMSLVADDDRAGIPRVLVSRSSLQADGIDDAVRRATPPGRAGGYAHLVAERGGRHLTVETSATRHGVRDDDAAHTNHYLDARLSAAAPPPERGSRSRLERLRVLLAECRPSTPEDAMEILRDHVGDPQAICVHPDPADGEEAAAILFSMVCHLEERRMWVAAGNPCEAPYEEIDLRGVI